MRILAVIVGLAVAFFLGILLGVHLDWSTWLEKPTGVTMTWFPTEEYEIESYGQTNLRVYPEDVLDVARPDGSTDIVMNFKGGNSPCEEGDKVAQCTIVDNPQPGPFFFSCDSKDKKYKCPDPGIQPQTTGPIQNGYSLQTLTYSQDIADVWAHLFKPEANRLKVEANLIHARPTFVPQNKQVPPGSTVKPKDTTTTPAQESGYVECNQTKNTAEVNPLEPHEPADTPIPLPKGGTLTWVANSNFTVTFNPGPGPCYTASPISSSLTDEGYVAACTQATPAGTYTYTVNLSGCKNPTGNETLSVTP